MEMGCKHGCEEATARVGPPPKHVYQGRRELERAVPVAPMPANLSIVIELLNGPPGQSEMAGLTICGGPAPLRAAQYVTEKQKGQKRCEITSVMSRAATTVPPPFTHSLSQHYLGQEKCYQVIAFTVKVLDRSNFLSIYYSCC